MIGCSLSAKFNSTNIGLIYYSLIFQSILIKKKKEMLSRSSSFTSSCTESVNENLKSTTNVRHHESLQNLRQTRPMLSRPLNIENNNQNHLPIISHNIKRTTTGGILAPTQNLPINCQNNDKKVEQQIDTIKRTIIEDDIENIQERFNEMLIAVPPTNDNETLLQPTEQISTTQYFTPKISIDENGKKKIDEDDDDDDDDDDLYRKIFYSIIRENSFFDF